MFFDHYPYTNFHNINLDWVLQAVKAWGQTVEANDRAFQDLKEANEDFKAYVTNYLQDLDITDEINTKLDAMLASGVLTPYFAPYVQGYVNSWLNSHVTPTSPALDNTLTLSGAAARADTTGKRLKDLAYIDALSTPEVYAAINRSQVMPGYRVQGVTYDYDGHFYVCGGSVDADGTGVIVKMSSLDFKDAEMTVIQQLGHANDITYYDGYLYVCTVGGGDAPQWGIYKINVNDFTDKTLISNAPENTIGIAYRQGDFWLLAPYRIYRTTDFTSYEVVVDNTNDLMTAYGIPTSGRISQTIFRAAGYLIGWVCSFVSEERHYGAITFFSSTGQPVSFKMFPAYHSELQGAVYADMSIWLLADGNLVNVFRMDPRHLSYIQLKAGDDLNDFTGRGTLYSTGSNVSSELVNSPSAGEGFTVQVERLGVYNTIQTARTNSGRELYRVKSFSVGTWGEWIEPGAEVAQIKEDLSANAESTDYSVKQLSSFKNVDGYVYIEPTDWEIGGFNVSNGVITYGANSKRIRTKQGFGYTVFAGDVIGLKDYAELGFYVALKYAKDEVIYSGGFKSADYTVPNDGEIYIYIAKRSAEVQIDNVYNYLGNLFIRRVDSTVSSIKKSYSGLSQYAIDHQNDTPIVFSDPSINNIIVCGKNIFRTPHGMTTYNSNNVYKTFNEKNGTITVRSDGATGNVVAPNTYTEVNGVAWNCMYKFKLPSATNVVFSTNADKDLYLYGKIYAQISDGNKVINAYNEPVIFKAEANTEYGVRIYSASGYADTVTFKPQIELGTTNRTEFEAFSGIVDENGSIISINTPSENLETGVIVKGYTATIISYDNAVSFTCEAPTEYDNGNAIYRIKNSKPAYKKPMLSFIDDDTTSTAFVEQYYNVMHGLGVVGNYAAITKKLTENEALKNLLLQYEAEGYGVLLHCYNQVGTDTDYFRPDSARNIDLVRTNMITGLRTMNDFGFISKDYWVTPYGVNDVEIKELAKSLGLKAVISTLNDTPNTQKTDRYEIGRYSFAATETSIAQNIPCIKRGMDACIENGGWVIVTTHVNSWGEGASIASDALSEIVDYANEIGMKIVNFQEGFETYIG